MLEAIQSWILQAGNSLTVEKERILHTLSLRIQRLTALLPYAIRTYGLFLVKGPALTGAHYRSADPNPGLPCVSLLLSQVL